MLIKLLPIQIPVFWNEIKYAMTQVTELDEIGGSKNLVKLLDNLISGRSFCYVRLNEDRILDGIFVLRINKNEFTDEKSMVIDCMYSFKRASEDEYIEMFSKFEELAKENECKHILAWTNVDRILELCEIVGLKEKCRLLSKPII